MLHPLPEFQYLHLFHILLDRAVRCNMFRHLYTERNELLKVILEKIDYYKGADGEIVIDLYPRLPKI